MVYILIYIYIHIHIIVLGFTSIFASISHFRHEKKHTFGALAVSEKTDSPLEPGKVNIFNQKKQVSHEKYLGWLGYIGDEQLTSYIGIIINHEIRIPINQPVGK